RSGSIIRQSKKPSGRATRRKAARPGRSTDVIAPHTRSEDLVGAEWAEWYGLTPAERWRESGKLWASFLALGDHLIPNPILRVLSSMRAHSVRALLMCGQACVLYGAAEFSRDLDLPSSPVFGISRHSKGDG